MKQIGYLYNNEAIGSIAIGFFLKLKGKSSISESLLILPFVLHNPTVKKLRNNSLKRSLEEFILKNPECLINFNSRYIDFLPLSINCILLLNDLGVIKIHRDQLYYNDSIIFSPEDSNTIGTRAKYIFPALDALNEIMVDQDEDSLYLKLKIVL